MATQQTGPWFALSVAERGLRTGRHYLILSFDDLEAGRYLPRPLSTVAFDYDLAARLCLKMLRHPQAGAAKRLLPMQVIVRGTSHWRN